MTLEYVRQCTFTKKLNYLLYFQIKNKLSNKMTLEYVRQGTFTKKLNYLLYFQIKNKLL